jgi:ABC-type antimicrobial peptide transport system permease subunit
VPDKKVVLEQIKKLMGWCPMKDSLRNEGQVELFYGHNSENRSKFETLSAEFQERNPPKVKVLYKGYGIPKIVFSMIVAELIVYIFKLYTGSFIFDTFLPLILYITLLALILYNRTTAVLTPEMIVVQRCLFKSLILRKEDITQIKASKNKGHSYRLPLRLLLLAVLITTLPQTIERITRSLYTETTPLSYKLIGVLVDLWMVAYILVIYYYVFELAAPYQQVITITTRANLNLEFYTDEPEEIMGILKNEKYENEE